MNNTSIEAVLLALLLALKSFQQPLNNSEKKNLQDVGKQLETDYTQWNCIYDDLIKIIDNNIALKEEYQKFLSQVISISPNSLLNILPDDTEIKTELPKDICTTRKGFFEIPEDNSDKHNEISNVTLVIIEITVAVFKDEDPMNLAKKPSFLNRLGLKIFNKGK